MKKYLVLILSTLFLTGCTKEDFFEQYSNTESECEILSTSYLSRDIDIVKIKCSNNLYRCFKMYTGYAGGIDCFEVQE